MDDRLYLAATEGKEEYLTEVEGSPSETENDKGVPDERYFLTQTAEGDNLLHLAASRDRLGFIVKALEKIPASVLLISWGNNQGENPLHIAARLGQLDTVQVLVNQYKSHLLEVEPELASYDNNASEGVLYLAAAYGHESVLETILTSTVTYSLSAPVGLTPLHVAVDTPLLRAASLGQSEALRAILLHCPESLTICDPNGKTPLHLAEFRSYQEGADFLRIPAIKRLVNKPDLEGNTPLHIAGKNSDHVLAKLILDTDMTGVTLVNKDGLTPWDIIKLQPEPTQHMAEIGYQLLMHSSDEKVQPQLIQQMTPRTDDVNERFRRNFNTLGLIAVILAAITFAAGFISAGGFNPRGHAILTREVVFKVFIISNAAAMSGYTIVFFSTLWAMMIARRDDEPKFLLSFSIHVLQLAFTATLIAFASSVYALTSAESLWLAILAVCLPSSAVILTMSKSVVFRLARFFYRTRLC